MPFINGAIPPSRTFDPVAARWTSLDGPHSSRYVLMVLLWVCSFLLVAIALFLRAAPMLRAIFREHLWTLPCFLAVLLALVPAHELIHALAYGCGLRSPNLIAGVWPKRGIAYVIYDTPLPRQRVLRMLVAPFLVLSVAPLFAAPFLSGPSLILLAFFSLLHAALCAGDAVTVLRLLRLTPPGAMIHNDGWDTYWGPSPSSTPPSAWRGTRRSA